MTNDHLLIRPARPSDRDAIFEMVKTVWGGDDYVPYVWDEWLADPSGPLLVGVLGAAPVALAKLSRLGPGEDWFHGMRVDPGQRGKGIGRAMLRRCVEIARERGARALRYLTDAENPTMHRMGEELGFRLLYAPQWYRAPMSTRAPAIVPVPPDQLPALLDDLRRSSLLERTGGMYSYDWRNLELTEARLREHLARGEVQALPNEHAWAIVVPNEDNGAWLAHLEGEGDRLERLCAAIPVNPAAAMGSSVRALLPPDAPHIPALTMAGFAETGDHMRVYELRIG